VPAKLWLMLQKALMSTVVPASQVSSASVSPGRGRALRRVAARAPAVISQATP
jgi:hypothetical protein